MDWSSNALLICQSLWIVNFLGLLGHLARMLLGWAGQARAYPFPASALVWLRGEGCLVPSDLRGALSPEHARRRFGSL
jgi:hypothetical protein